MASTRLRASPVTPGAGLSPGSGVLEASTPADGRDISKDEAIWKRLMEAGFDEEAVKKRDKAALVGYIAKIESELYEYQYSMGLLILEKKEWTSKYEQVKESADLAEIAYKRDQAAQASALAEARKQEESLKRALAIEKECVANIEKALHEMRAESAETKLAYESKLAEAHEMMETAQNKFEEADSKIRSAESLYAEANRCRSTALRNLQDVEAREDELRRRLISFQSECDTKEKELSLQRQSLYDSQRLLHQEQDRLLEGQTLLNQREDYIFQRSKELSRFEKVLDEAKSRFEEASRILKEKKSNFDLEMAALATREEAVIERESQLDRRERELLLLQEKISSKEYDEFRRLAAEHKSSLERKRQEFEADLEKRRKLFDDEMETRKTAYEDRESQLIERENFIQEKENSIEVQLKELSKSREDLANKLKLLDEKEQNLQDIEKAAEMGMLNVQKEREAMNTMRVELESIKSSLEAQRKAILHEQEKLELSIHERNELLVLETKLKEEIDSFRSTKMEVDAEADKLRAEKEKFETEWELIDEKKEELRKEAERVAEERRAICLYLKNEHDSIKLEKDNLRNQFKMEAESLSREREEFMSKMEREHLDWVIKIQREREDFVKDVNIQRKELENCIEKRREEVDTYLREKEEAFDQERVKELQHINSQKEMIAKQLEHVSSELKKLHNEKVEIALDREQREKEWSEIKNSIEVLNIQREKLQKQRELLHADREEIYQKIQHLNRLEHWDIESENRALTELRFQQLQLSKSKFPIKKCVNTSVGSPSIDDRCERRFSGDGGSKWELLSEKPSPNASPPLSATVSLVKKYARAIFMRSTEKVGSNSERNVESYSSKLQRASAGKEDESPKLNSFKKIATDGKKVRSYNGETTEIKKTMTATYALENTGVTPDMPSLDRNVVSIPEIEHKNSADKGIAQLKEDAANDSVNGTNMLLKGRKRLNDLLSNDYCVIQNHQKKARQNGNDAIVDESPVCIMDNGRSHGSENPSLAADAVLLSSTCCQAQEEETGSAFLEAGEPANKISVEGDGYNYVSNEGVDAEEDSGDEAEEIKASRLQKIWFFLTT